MRQTASFWLRRSVTSVLLVCGIGASLLYAALNAVVPFSAPGYSSASQTVSELSAVGAPTRMLWMLLCMPYTLLSIAFAWGVWLAAGRDHGMRVAGGLLLAYAALGLLWPFAPMHSREALAAGGGTFSDTMHIALGAGSVLLMLLAITRGSAASGRVFRVYSIASVVALLVFGFLTFLNAPDIARNAPTPWIGVWERVDIGVFLLWQIVLALVLLTHRPTLLPMPSEAS